MARKRQSRDTILACTGHGRPDHLSPHGSRDFVARLLYYYSYSLTRCGEEKGNTRLIRCVRRFAQLPNRSLVVLGAPMTMADELGPARESWARHAWGEAYERLAAADRQHVLDPDDLERLAMAA